MVALYESRKGLPPTDPTDAEYNLPRDEYVLCLSAIFHSRSSGDKTDDSITEHSRLDTQADGFLPLMHNRLVHAPLQTPLKVIDICCGTGATTRQLAALEPLRLGPWCRHLPRTCIRSQPSERDIHHWRYKESG